MDEKVTLSVQGMTCAACVASVSKVVGNVEGVSHVSVNLPLEKAWIEIEPGFDQADIKTRSMDAIRKAGFQATELKSPLQLRGEAEEHVAKQKRKVAVAFLMILPVFILTMFVDPLGRWNDMDIRWLCAFFLTAPIYFWSGLDFHKGAYASLRGGSANMDVLVTLGTSVGFFWSTIVTFSPLFPQSPDVLLNADHVFFDGVAFIIGFVLFGNVLESNAKLQATDAIHSLMRLQPRQARVLNDEGQVEMVDVETIEMGTRLRLLAGDTVPLDAQVVDGSTSIDESMMTGEAYPVRKKEGDDIRAGTILLDGTLEAVTTSTADDSHLAKIIQFVEQAQMGKAPIQRLVDKISSLFVPIVVLFAIIASLLWYLNGSSWASQHPMEPYEIAIMVFVSTMVIACPCALGLATPTALVVGTGRGARFGLLVKGIEALEASHKTNVLLVDKTGTLTAGKPRVSHIEWLDGEVREVLQIAAALEEHSTHPFALAVQTAWSNLTQEKPTATEVVTFPGMGVVGVIEGEQAMIGTPLLLSEQGFELSEPHREILEQGASRGASVACVVLGQRLLGTIEFKDRIRESTPNALKQARIMGMTICMVTGDRKEAAMQIADELDIETVHAGVLPQEKGAIVQSYQEQGNVVAMVGDGINDAAALVQADVGIAMGDGSQIALESADIVLSRNDLSGATAALELGQVTMRKIRSNLAWAFIYNLIGIPFAMGVFFFSTGWFLPPAFAAAAMSLSSVSVVSNSLLLRFWKPKSFME